MACRVITPKLSVAASGIADGGRDRGRQPAEKRADAAGDRPHPAPAIVRRTMAEFNGLRIVTFLTTLPCSRRLVSADRRMVFRRLHPRRADALTWCFHGLSFRQRRPIIRIMRIVGRPFHDGSCRLDCREFRRGSDPHSDRPTVIFATPGNARGAGVCPPRAA